MGWNMQYFCLVILTLAFNFIFLEVSHILRKTHRVSVSGKACVLCSVVWRALFLLWGGVGGVVEKFLEPVLCPLLEFSAWTPLTFKDLCGLLTGFGLPQCQSVQGVAVWEQGRVNGGQFLHLGLGGPHSGMPDNVLGRMALRGEKRGMGLPPAPMSPIVQLWSWGTVHFLPQLWCFGGNSENDKTGLSDHYVFPS